MRLHEEYMNRIGLKVPVVLFEKSSEALLVSREPRDGSFQWSRIVLDWVHNESWHPGHFIYSKYDYRHDMSSRSRYGLGEKTEQKELYWDEYEDFVINKMGDFREDFEVVAGKRRLIELARLTMTCCDRVIADVIAGGKMSKRFVTQIASVFDPDCDLDSRYEAAELALEQMRTALPSNLSDGLANLMGRRFQSEWLETIGSHP